MTRRLWWPYANKITQRQGKSDIGASISSEPAQMKGRGIDLRDSNGHSLLHLSVRPSDLVTTNALVLTKPLHFADLELEFLDCWERLGKELKFSRHQINRTKSP